MKILFATGHLHFPEASGGVQSSTDHLIRQSISAGHSASLLCRYQGSGKRNFIAKVTKKLLGRPGFLDHNLGYSVMRCWNPCDAVPWTVDDFKPDVALVQCQNSIEIAAALEAQSVPACIYFRNVEFDELGGDPSTLTNSRFIANSEFTAKRYKDVFGVDSTVLPPSIDPKKYTFENTREFVTFINLDPKKGLSLATEVARACPDVPFLFVESWPLWPDQFAEIETSLSELPNVTLMRRTNNMGEIYGRTKILLAPSQWEEAWGRVASEAHCSGIPVVGSNRGGLPEAIGPAGVVLPYDGPVTVWSQAIQELWHDTSEYERISKVAREYAQRPQLNIERQAQVFFDVILSAAHQRTSAQAICAL